jgi:predicted MFS family arabinose efflux permease
MNAAALRVALALALASTVSLGLARFSYALLLPPMRADLGWSYFTAGAMNTLNAAGYLIGALLAPRLMRRWDARLVMLAGGFGAALLLALHGVVRHEALLGALRLATGVASALSFVGGGLLAARLANGMPQRSGLVLGVYYGGVGLGIMAAALLVPLFVDGFGGVATATANVTAGVSGGPAPTAKDLGVLTLPWNGLKGWSAAWVALAAAAALASGVTALGTRSLALAPQTGAARAPFSWRPFAPALAGYTMFGLGYIGYMTFIISLLREQGMAPGRITAFYVLLGAGVAASPWLWAWLLQGYRDGKPLALLNGLLAVATALPVWSQHPAAVFSSGLLFGCVFLSLVASTTALVRHNCAPAVWPSGIAAFTVVFAAGQIVGPTVVGWIADGPGGLARGFVVSAALLALGSALASRQRALLAA